MASMFEILISTMLISCVLAIPMERQKRQDADEVNICGKYEMAIKNLSVQTRCIPKAGSCAGSPDFVYISCFVSPCLTFKQKCPQASYCYTDACNSCKARMYDFNYNEVCSSGPSVKLDRSIFN